MANELLMGKGYDEKVDWWSVGVIFVEMVIGLPPFFGETPEEVFANICEYSKVLEELEQSLNTGDLQGDPNLSKHGWTFTKSLLCEPEDRIGKLGGHEILNHPYFANVPVANLRLSKPPFVPHLENESDLSYFDSESAPELSEELISSESMQEIMTGISADKALPGFTFRRPTQKSPNPSPGGVRP